MQTKFKNKAWIITGILLFILITDQLTKIWARGTLQTDGPYIFLNGWLRFEHAENPGAFMSLGASLSDTWRQFFFQGGVVLIFNRDHMASMEERMESHRDSGTDADFVWRNRESDRPSYEKQRHGFCGDGAGVVSDRRL
jgi:hypothetical protein